MRRKLAVILASDVAGYSRLVSLDEETTIARFAKLKQAMAELIGTFNGRIFNMAGDAVLAEFPSAVDAVRCAIEIQETARARNLAFRPEQHMLLRIGIAIGDVLIQGDDLLGDGVNIAARLESIATPGGICLSEEVHAYAARNVSVEIVDIGEQALKNIPEPVRVFAIALPGMASSRPAAGTPASAPMPKASQPAPVAGNPAGDGVPILTIARGDRIGGGDWGHEPESGSLEGEPLERAPLRRGPGAAIAFLGVLGLAGLIAVGAWWLIRPVPPVETGVALRPGQTEVTIAVAPPATPDVPPTPPATPPAPPARPASPPATTAEPSTAPAKPPEPAKPAEPATPPAASVAEAPPATPPSSEPPAPSPSSSPSTPGPLSPDLRAIATESTAGGLASMPFLRNEPRQRLAQVYSQQPGHKAVAVSLDGQGYWSARWGHPTPEAASEDAIRRCEETAGSTCAVYMLDDSLVWPREATPMPPAAVLAPRETAGAFDPTAIAGLGRDQRVQLLRAQAQTSGHSAVVLAPDGRATWFTGQDSPAEAMRRALERCGLLARAACLPVALDGRALTRFPAAHRVASVDAAGAFLAGKAEPPAITRYLAAPDWRAVALGRSGRATLVSGGASEAEATDAALAQCRRADADCRLAMIGLFRVE